MPANRTPHGPSWGSDGASGVAGAGPPNALGLGDRVQGSRNAIINQKAPPGAPAEGPLDARDVSRPISVRQRACGPISRGFQPHAREGSYPLKRSMA